MRGQFQTVVPMTPVVKKLIIINLVVWFLTILMSFVTRDRLWVEWLGLHAYRVIQDF